MMDNNNSLLSEIRQMNTNLKNLVFGDKVNIETDIVSKYVKKFLTSDKQKIDENFLLENGFM